MEQLPPLNRIYSVARQNRHNEPDTIYHVTARGVERRAIFLTDKDRQYFMSLLLGALRASECSLFAFCLMGNHFHLLVAAGKTPLGTPLHLALTTYALRFNSANKRVGHLFQDRFHSRPVYDRHYLHNVIAYIHANPVRAKLVPTPEAWRWSSHEDWARLNGDTIDFHRLEKLVGVSARAMRDDYLSRVHKTSKQGPQEMSLEEVIVDTCRTLGINPESVKSGARGAIYSKAKSMMLERALIEGYSARQLALALNCTPASLTMSRKRRAKARPFC